MNQEIALEERIRKSYMNHAPAMPTIADRRISDRRAKSVKLEETNISPRLKDALAEKKIHTLGQLVKHTKGDLERIKGVGRKSLVELDYLVNSYGLQFVKMRMVKD